MSIAIQKSNQLKSIAILMMLCLHLFNPNYKGLFTPLIFVGQQPMSYYISLFCDACVPIFAFVSGYGLYASYRNRPIEYLRKNLKRTKKLYIRYWLILLLFVVILGGVLGKEGHPGNLQKFILNFTGISTSYNGAWWYFTIYILFVFTSKLWFRLLDNFNPHLYLVLLLLIYLLAFYFRIYRPTIFENPILQWIHTQGALYFCTLFQFMLGAFSMKYRWHEKVTAVFARAKYKNLIAMLGIVLLIILHGLIPNFIIASFTGLGFIFLFLQIRLSKRMDKILDFFNPHSTNFWLIHMFFYLIYFKEIIYLPKYPVLIFGWLVLWCIIASYFVNAVYKKVENAI